MTERRQRKTGQHGSPGALPVAGVHEGQPGPPGDVRSFLPRRARGARTLSRERRRVCDVTPPRKTAPDVLFPVPSVVPGAGAPVVDEVQSVPGNE